MALKTLTPSMNAPRILPEEVVACGEGDADWDHAIFLVRAKDAVARLEARRKLRRL